MKTPEGMKDAVDVFKEQDEKGLIQTKKFPEGTKAIVKTLNSTYEITFVNARRGDILIKGGTRFKEDTPVGFSGCTWGCSMLSSGSLGIGMHMELYRIGESGCLYTSPIESVRIIKVEESDD